MFKSLVDKLYHHWQGRFQHGIGVGFGGVAVHRYSNGAYVLAVQGPNFASPGTGHWPWYVLDIAIANGPKPSWHLGILGLTVGKVVVNSYDDELKEIVGPDRNKYYFFFKGINHQQQEFEEIIT